MADDEPKWFQPGYRPPELRPTPGEMLFEFTRIDNAPMSCELVFRGETYGWEARILKRGEFFMSHGAFTTKAAAIRWAEEMRRFMRSPGLEKPVPPVPIP